MELLNPTEIRRLAQAFGVTPTKTWGQNFVHDGATVRKIVREAQCDGAQVVEVGPGLGSLTLGLLEAGCQVAAVEIDPRLAAQLATTVAAHAPELEPGRFSVVNRDALTVSSIADLGIDWEPRALVANLPYNVAVPVLLRFLEIFPSIETVTVMVQLEVAQRLAATPGSKIYGVPSVKAQWYGDVTLGSRISRQIFWPVPNVDSALVHIRRHEHPVVSPDVDRDAVFALVDAAFAQRRKTLRQALAGVYGSPVDAAAALEAAGIDPSRRGETLSLADFVTLARGGER